MMSASGRWLHWYQGKPMTENGMQKNTSALGCGARNISFRHSRWAPPSCTNFEGLFKSPLLKDAAGHSSGFELAVALHDERAPFGVEEHQWRLLGGRPRPCGNAER